MFLKKMAAAVALALGFMPGALAKSIDKDAHGKLDKALQALYAEKDGKFVLDVEGEEDVGGLKSALQKERDAAKLAAKELKEFKALWEGLDPAEIRKLVDKLGGDEEAQLIKAGKIDEVVAKRMDKANQAHAKALKDMQAKIDASDAKAGKYAGRVLDDAVRAASTKAGLHANAVDDALFRARTMFTLDEEGNAVQLKDGAVVMGKDSKTPYSPAEWLEGMRETAPHWFPAGNTGGGASGGKGGAQGKTMKRSDWEAMTNPVEKAAAARSKDVTIIDG